MPKKKKRYRYHSESSLCPVVDEGITHLANDCRRRLTL